MSATGLSDVLAGIRGGRLKQDADGNALCDCGAVLEPSKFICQSCVEDNRRRAAARSALEQAEAYRASIETFAAPGMQQLPDWPHARTDTKAFLDAVHVKLAKVAKRYALDRTLTLLGATGTGKTTCAIAALHHQHDTFVQQTLAQHSRPAPQLALLRRLVWTTATALAQARRQHPLGVGEAPLIERALNAPLVIIDDLGHEPLGGSELWEVVDSAYQRGAKLLITSGLRPAAIRERYGDAFFRRISETGAAVVEVWD